MNPPARAVPITVVDKRTPRPPVAAAARAVEGIPPVARPPVGEIADFMWLDGSGEIAKPLEESPIQDGIALLHQNEPLPHGASWAITIHDANGVLVFRSGPLPALPGPPSPVNASYVVLMLTDGASFGLAPNEGAEALVLEQLHGLPKALRIDSVSMHADSAGREVVVVRGTVKRFLFSQSFAYTRALTLRPSKRPGHPAEVIVAEPSRAGVGRRQRYPCFFGGARRGHRRGRRACDERHRPSGRRRQSVPQQSKLPGDIGHRHRHHGTPGARQRRPIDQLSGRLWRHHHRRPGRDRDGRLAARRRAAMISSAAATPVMSAPCAVEKSCAEHASPAKNRRSSTGAARIARQSARPGSA
jgi:hypothetical protein